MRSLKRVSAETRENLDCRKNKDFLPRCIVYLKNTLDRLARS